MPALNEGKKIRQLTDQLPEVHPGGTHDGVYQVARHSLQPVPVHSVFLLQMRSLPTRRFPVIVSYNTTLHSDRTHWTDGIASIFPASANSRYSSKSSLPTCPVSHICCYIVDGTTFFRDRDATFFSFIFRATGYRLICASVNIFFCNKNAFFDILHVARRYRIGHSGY